MWRRKSKYRAKRTADGFPSKLERAVYFKLKDREALGEISDIRRQHVVVLQEGDKETRINWKIDFSFLDNKSGKRCFCEAKGVEDLSYKLKLKLFLKLKPGPIEIWKGSYLRPFLFKKYD